MLTLFDDLDPAGIDPASLSRTPDASMAENADALERGEVGVVAALLAAGLIMYDVPCAHAVDEELSSAGVADGG